MVIDFNNSETLYAAGWTRIRNNNESALNSNVARIYKTTDGGANWETLSGGLPQEELSRPGLAMSATNPNKIYVLHIGTNQDVHGVYLTLDAGTTWTSVPTLGLNNAVGGFGWYFGRIDVNPTNDDQLFLHGVSFWTGISGAWTTVNIGTHADKHDLAFTSTGDMILATDGGLYRSSDGGVHASFDAGVTWERLGNNMPIIPVYDLEHNVANNELIAGTFARSIQTISLDAVLTEVLAANWLTFEAQQKEETVELVWEVQSDASTSHYEIQHATDGKTFQTIGQQESQHATIEKYRFNHRHPVKGENYYRIAELDEQGKVSYSNIQQVDIDELTTAAIQLYPNPTTDKVVIDYQKITEQAVVQFWTMDGKLLMTKSIDESQTTYNIQHFTKGQYVVKIVDRDKVESLLLHKK